MPFWATYLNQCSALINPGLQCHHLGWTEIARRKVIENKDVKVFEHCRHAWHGACIEKLDKDRTTLIREGNTAEWTKTGTLVGEHADKRITFAQRVEHAILGADDVAVAVEQSNDNTLYVIIDRNIDSNLLLSPVS